MWLPTFFQRGIHFFGKQTEGFGLNNFVIFDRVHLPIIGRRAAVVEEGFAACDQPATSTNALNFSGSPILSHRSFRMTEARVGVEEGGNHT
jgi:hypothetical protein